MPEPGEKWQRAFLYWWPVFARVCGIGGAFANVTYAMFSGQNADAGFLAFCAGLIAAPAVFDGKSKKSDHDEEK